MPAAPTYTDGVWTTALAVSLPVFSAPIPALENRLVLTQEWEIALASYAALTLNTAHPDYATFYLVSEGPHTDLGAGLVRWTRTYAAVPPTHDEFQSYIYNFIGFLGAYVVYNGTTNILQNGRERFSRRVTARITNEFFLVGSGQTYTSAALIPVISGQSYYAGSINAYYNADYLWDGGSGVAATVPTRSDYQTMIATGEELVAEDSTLTRWMGNIWKRETVRILAQ